MDDTEIIHALQKGGRGESTAIQYLRQSKAYQRSARQALRQHKRVRLSSWEDVLHESLIKLISGIKQGKFKEGNSILAYFQGICYNVCRELSRKENKESEFPELELPPKSIEDLRTPLSIALREDLRAALSQALSQLGGNCQEVLLLWSQSYSGEEIAGQTALSNRDVVKTTVLRCKKNLRKLLREDIHLATILKELRWI